MKILKLLSTVMSAALISAVVCGCDDGNSPVSPASPAGENMGRVVIPLPKNQARNSRSVGLEAAQTNTNVYEAIFIKDGASLSVTAEEGADQLEATILEGVYTILLAAGCKSALATPLLLASGYVEGKTIGVGENVIEITLRPVVVDIIAPDSVVQNQTFEVQININTKNPFIELATLLLGCSVSSDKINSAQFSNSGDVYTWTYEVSAPPTTGYIDVFIAQTFKIVQKSTWYIGYYNSSNSSFKDVQNSYRKTIAVAVNDNLPKVVFVIEWAE